MNGTTLFSRSSSVGFGPVVGGFRAPGIAAGIDPEPRVVATPFQPEELLVSPFPRPIRVGIESSSQSAKLDIAEAAEDAGEGETSSSRVARGLLADDSSARSLVCMLLLAAGAVLGVLTSSSLSSSPKSEDFLALRSPATLSSSSSSPKRLAFFREAVCVDAGSAADVDSLVPREPVGRERKSCDSACCRKACASSSSSPFRLDGGSLLVISRHWHLGHGRRSVAGHGRLLLLKLGTLSL